jgi:hypothetical protein
MEIALALEGVLQSSLDTARPIPSVTAAAPAAKPAAKARRK